jgi:futalosine hydrolase
MRILIVTSVPAETDAIGSHDGVTVVTGGIGRTNAAASTTEAILRNDPFAAVVNAGIAGVLPGSKLAIGDTVVASACVYAEEGLVTPAGFADMAEMGFSLGDFRGNAVPVDDGLLGRLAGLFPTGSIATVATCSGTDAAAESVARRTLAVAEAMEGAAVVHAARRLGVPAIELRVISNTTGDRDNQEWDLAGAMAALGRSVGEALVALQ